MLLFERDLPFVAPRDTSTFGTCTENAPKAFLKVPVIFNPDRDVASLSPPLAGVGVCCLFFQALEIETIVATHP